MLYAQKWSRRNETTRRPTTIMRRDLMDFDPHGKKWDCCCCRLPSGLQILATCELLVAIVISAITIVHIVKDGEKPSYFEICLILMMLLMALTSTLLILGIYKHDTNLMYPTIAARLLFIIFVQVFGVSTVVAPQEVQSKWERTEQEEQGREEEKEQNVALRLVFLVFAMLFITVFVFYCIYLVVRGIQYERCYSRMKIRRESFIQASMIDPNASSRRTSSIPGLTSIEARSR
ncbi:hypothetical protein GCK32_008198 [Trichostrongylus colubriformis]|uniref:DUF7027 domain-containing protein n=1 Tax=Trichostrongylus colubriformis TaxID=6319 RepID=A0AAN8ESM8_TRICO